MTEDFKKFVLHNAPTKVLLRAFKHARNYYTSPFQPMEVSYDHDEPVRIEVGKFASWNPYKGHGCTCEFTTTEVKHELDTREHITR